MSAKPDAKEAAPAAAADKNAAPAAPKPSLVKSLLPAVIAVIAAPAACWAVAQFVLLPQLQKKLVVATSAGEHAADGGDHAAAEAAPAAEEKKGGEGGGHGGKEGGKEGNANGYEFSNVVVNLAGTMGTRYLKTTFLVTGANNSMRGLFESKKPQLTDVTLNVLSSLTLAELEEPGAKNLLREKLVAAYNQALGKRVADQVYFSDFVIQ